MPLAATRTVEIGFSSNPGTAIGSTTWTDVTSDVRSVTTHRGRQRELDQFAAGTATIVLNNRLRRYDPQYTGAGAPYNGNIVPMRRIRIRGVYNAVTYDLFSGFIDGWEQRYDPPNEATAVVTATDAFKVLANIALASSVYAVEVAVDGPTSWWRLGEPAGSTTLLDVLSGAQAAVVGTPTLGAAGLVVYEQDSAVTFAGSGDTMRIELPRYVWQTSGAWSLEFWVSGSAANPNVLFDHLFRDGPFNLQVSTTGAGFGLLGAYINVNGAPASNIFTTVKVMDGSRHHIVIVGIPASVLKIYVDGVDNGVVNSGTGIVPSAPDQTTYAINGVSPGTTGGYTIDEVAFYNPNLSAARIAAHNTAGRTPWNGDLSGARIGRILDAIGWPAADRNINSGLSVLQSADLNTTALAVLQKIEATEQGLLFVNGAGQVRFVGRTEFNSAPYTTSQATFGDSGSELRYAGIAFTYNDQLIYNEIKVSRTGGTVQTVTDTTSQTSYLKRSQTLDGLLHNSDNASRDLANYRLAIYKDPLNRLTGLTVAPERAPATLYPQALGREIGDRITVKRRPQGVGSAISQDANIEGISHTITPDSWVTVWNLSPANVLQFWLVGTAGFSELDQTTRLGF